MSDQHNTPSDELDRMIAKVNSIDEQANYWTDQLRDGIKELREAIDRGDYARAEKISESCETLRKRVQRDFLDAWEAYKNGR